MPLNVAFQMDHVSTLSIRGDTTFALMLEGQRRGHRLLHYTSERLTLRDERVLAVAEPVKVADEPGRHYELGEAKTHDLAECDVVMMRQDPPFDMAYITATHLLEHVHPETLVVNDPQHVRNAPEKLFVTHFPGLMPPTLITSDRAEILDFRAQHEDIIVKPLFGNGGAGVFHITSGDENLNALLELFTQLYREPIIVQKYLPEVRAGDLVFEADEAAALFAQLHVDLERSQVERLVERTEGFSFACLKELFLSSILVRAGASEPVSFDRIVLEQASALRAQMERRAEGDPSD
jgi:glutathione synthase